MLKILVMVLIDGRNRAFLGISRCSNKDNFVRAIGREIAKGRAIKAISFAQNNKIIPCNNLYCEIEDIERIMSGECIPLLG